MASNELGGDIEGVSRMVPNIRRLVAPIIDVAHDLQNTLGSINLRKVPSSYDGMCQTSVNVNTMTNKFHTGQDFSYTVNNVPSQDFFLTLEETSLHIRFQNEGENISINLCGGIVFLFSGKCLINRRNYSDPCSPKDDIFINFAYYGMQPALYVATITVCPCVLSKG